MHETVLVVSSSICFNDFFRLITSPELYDVTLLSEEGTELRCHKCILVARLGTYENLTICNTFFFSIFVEQFALTICVGSKRILVGLAVNWPKF